MITGHLLRIDDNRNHKRIVKKKPERKKDKGKTRIVWMTTSEAVDYLFTGRQRLTPEDFIARDQEQWKDIVEKSVT